MKPAATKLPRVRYGMAPSQCLATTLLALLALTVSARAGGDCATIRDHDRRRACQAETRQRPGACGQILDHDRRKLCQARTSADKSRCRYIQNHDLRRACQAGMAD